MVNPIAFRNNYKTDVPEMDQEHVCIVDGMNEVSHLVISDNMVDATSKLLEIRALMLEHFAHEEALMEEIDYKPLPYHKCQHEEILAELDKLLDPQDKDRFVWTPEDVNRSFVEHVNSYDRDYMDTHKKWLAQNEKSKE